MNSDSNTWTARYEILTTIEKDAVKQFIQFAAQIALAYLIVTSLRVEDRIELTIYSFVASFPVSFFLAAVSFLFLIASISFCHLSVALTLRANESGRLLLPEFSTSIYALLKGAKDDVSFGVPMFTNSFLKEKLPVSSFLSMGFFLGTISALLPFSAFSYSVFWDQLELFNASSTPTIERISVAAGMVLTVLSGLQILLFHLPLPMKKDVLSIRWNFLYFLTDGPFHPQRSKWTSERK